jgi:predicted neuraminidase
MQAMENRPVVEEKLSRPVVRAGFLYESAPFPSCHAVTLLETSDGGLLAAYFGGTHERHPDVCIYTSRFSGGNWGAPVQVADGVQEEGTRQPCWNPVLFRLRGGPVMLFYKVGPNPREWWGMVKRSDDDGRTWGPAQRLPDGILGPIKNKPVQLDSGDILSPTSIEGPQIGWRVYFERSSDGGRTWTATPWVEQDPEVRAIQPSILIHSPRDLQAVGRTKAHGVFEVWSHDGGRTWGKLGLTHLPNPNSGTDAVTLADGRHLLVYNHSSTEKVRYPLNVATSRDGQTWEPVLVLDDEPPGQYSYPAVIQTCDQQVHIAYTWKRERIKHVQIDPGAL